MDQIQEIHHMLRTLLERTDVQSAKIDAISNRMISFEKRMDSFEEGQAQVLGELEALVNVVLEHDVEVYELRQSEDFVTHKLYQHEEALHKLRQHDNQLWKRSKQHARIIHQLQS